MEKMFIYYMAILNIWKPAFPNVWHLRPIVIFILFALLAVKVTLHIKDSHASHRQLSFDTIAKKTKFQSFIQITQLCESLFEFREHWEVAFQLAHMNEP